MSWRRRRRRRRLVVLALALAAAGCTIQTDSAPRDIAPEERGVLEPIEPEAGAAAGASRVFLVDNSGGDPVLRSVFRDVEGTPEQLLDALLAGPNEIELDARLETAIPISTTLNAARRIGNTVSVDLSPEFLELAGEQFVLAAAQVVATASEIDGVSQVRLQVGGEPRAWPNGAGELEQGALTIYDFPGLVESAQPDFPAIPSPA